MGIDGMNSADIFDEYFDDEKKSEVEKMYENAGVEYGSCQNYNRFEQCCNSPFCDSGMCPNGIGGEKHPFTAEKQLELIKWLIQKNFYDERIIRSNFEKTYFYCLYIDDYCESEYFEKFAEALANVFNYFWQDLTEQERTEIAEILRG